MHKWIAFARFVDVDFAAKVAQRFHGKIKTGANVFRIRGSQETVGVSTNRFSNVSYSSR